MCERTFLTQQVNRPEHSSSGMAEDSETFPSGYTMYKGHKDLGDKLQLIVGESGLAEKQDLSVGLEQPSKNAVTKCILNPVVSVCI